jgi:hypothetical protein
MQQTGLESKVRDRALQGFAVIPRRRNHEVWEILRRSSSRENCGNHAEQGFEIKKDRVRIDGESTQGEVMPEAMPVRIARYLIGGPLNQSNLIAGSLCGKRIEMAADLP